MDILNINNLTISIDGKPLLKNISFSIPEGQSFILFGPNGSGKSSLIQTILGVGNYHIDSGKIFFYDQDITHLATDEKARLGIGLGFQYPPEVTGIKFIDLLKICEKKSSKDSLSEETYRWIKKLNLENLLSRDINVGFSGGERKKAEILQLLVMRPKLLLLDEPDSGVDMESFKSIALVLQEYLKTSGSSALIITHYGYIFDYLSAVKAAVLMHGEIYCYQNSRVIFEDIQKNGYSGCKCCTKRKVKPD